MAPAVERNVRLGLAAHALLAGSMALARAAEATFATPSAPGEPWTGLAAEVALAGWVLVLVAALGLALVATLRAPRPVLIALALLLAASLARRRTFDAFDLVYVLAVALAWALAAARGGRDARHGAGRASHAEP